MVVPNSIRFSTGHYPGFDLVTETSNVQHSTLAYNGFGDFLLETVISQQVAPENQFAGLNFSFGGAYSFGINYNNWGADIAAEAGIAPGLSVSFIQAEVASVTPTELYFSSFNQQRTPITAGAITGDIWLRLAFTDATDEFTASYSLDSGSTFSTIGSAVTPISNWGGVAGLIADPKEVAPVPEPGTGLLVAAGLVGLGQRSRRTRLRRPNIDSALRKF